MKTKKVTNENGYLIFDGEYEYDRYYVEEVEVRDYPRNEYLIIVDLNSNLFTAPFFHGKLGSIKVKNIDEKGNKLNGAFEITSPDFYGMGFDDLIVGTYYVKQTSVEEGYIIDEEIYEVKITKEDLNQEITIINKKHIVYNEEKLPKTGYSNLTFIISIFFILIGYKLRRIN